MRPPFFQATIAKLPQSNFHRHITVLPQDRHPLGNQPSPISATKMCAFDSRGAGLDSPRRLEIISQDLTPASGRQDHTSLPSASARLVKPHQRVHRIPPPTFVTIGRSAPLSGSGMRTDKHIFG